MTRQNSLDAVDLFLTDVKRLLQMPGYRRRFMAALGYSISPGTLRAVRAVERLGPSSPFVGEVAEALGVDASTATRLIDPAVRDGYLERVADKSDQRRVALSLTDEGRALLSRANSVRHDLLAEITRDWKTPDLKTLASLLERLGRDLRTLEE